MVIMEKDHLREIWQRIDQMHLSYLEMEESQEKIEHRNKLEDCIAEFLFIVSHSQKFYFPETAEILQRSATSKKDFSGYKAATGWNAIQLYAGNLLSQPWRKEYREIKTYCGFYVHQVKANLVGAERMFEAMGYKHVGDGILVLDGPICPDRVANVSKDCLVAYVECQILKAIWEEVSNLNITWLDILDFRKSHSCSLEQSVKALKYRQQRQFHQEHTRSYSHGSDPFAEIKYPTSSSHNTHSAMFPMNHSFPPLSAHNHVALAPAQALPQYVYSNGCCTNNLQPYPPGYRYLSFPQPFANPQINTNGYYYTNGFRPTVSSVPYGYCGVPTGQLIEVEPYNGYDEVDIDGPSHSRVRRVSKPEEPRKSEVYKPKVAEAHNNTVKEAAKEDPQYEDWDYVYRNLESKGYCKDVGDRGDVLSPENAAKHRRSREAKKQKPTDLDEAVNRLAIIDTKPLNISEALERFERKATENKPEERQPSAGSSYENLSPVELVKTVNQPSTLCSAASNVKTKSLPRDKAPSENAKTIHTQSKTLDNRKTKEEKVVKKDSWQCKACTYLNENSKDVCEMCSKSRDITEETPMEVGGAECSQCTLVNPRSHKMCQACGYSLENSPTYI